MIEKPAGFGKWWNNIKNLRETYLHKDDMLMKMYLPILNPNNGYVVFFLIQMIPKLFIKMKASNLLGKYTIISIKVYIEKQSKD